MSDPRAPQTKPTFSARRSSGKDRRQGAADDSGRRGLHWACWHGDLARVAELLDSGEEGDIEAASPGGRTPLHIATSCDHPRIVIELLEPRR